MLSYCRYLLWFHPWMSTLAPASPSFLAVNLPTLSVAPVMRNTLSFSEGTLHCIALHCNNQILEWTN